VAPNASAVRLTWSGAPGHVHIEHDVPTPEDEGKDPAAVALGRRGGKARAEGMSAKRRK
jgi:hypothetical protein